MSVTGKVILINGATRGLGFEYARSLAALGAKIVGGDVMDCDLPGAMPVKLDVTDPARPGDDGEKGMGQSQGKLVSYQQPWSLTRAGFPNPPVHDWMCLTPDA